MNQENRFPSHDQSLFLTFQKKLEINDEEHSSITPKRPLLSRDRAMAACIDVSPLSDHNSRFEQSKPVFSSTTPVQFIRTNQSSISLTDNHTFNLNLPQASRSTEIDEEENTCVPVYTQRKAKPAPSTTWKAPIPIPKSSTILKTNIESLSPLPELPPTPPLISFQPAIRARIPFNLSATNTIDKQTHAYTIWLNSLFTPVEFLCNTPANQSISNEGTIPKTLKSLAELNRWYILRDHAREIFTYDIQPITTKIAADIDIDHCRINPKSDLNFSARNVNRQALLNFISSYNRIWFHLAMEVIFPIHIENYPQMKIAIEQYLIQSTSSTSNENHSKKITWNKTASASIRLTIKNLIIIIIFLERAKLLRLIDNDPCLYNRDSKFKSTKESLDVLSRDFISSDTNLLRRLKLAGYEPIYRQTSLDEFNYLIHEQKLFEDLKDGIRLTRCTQILLSSSNEHVARFDLSTKLKCPVVNLVHKLLNIDQAFELLQTYGQVNLTGISNKDIMNGNKQRTLELLWRIFIVCYLPKYLSPMEKLSEELALLSYNLSRFACSSIEQQLLNTDILPLQKQHIHFTPMIHFLIKWVQFICAHYKFWIYDLQESFADGRAFLYIISYYLPSLCDYTRDIKHLTTLATCQTRNEHIQFNLELNQSQQSNQIYERNVKSNFRLLEDCIKQFGTFSYDLIKYDNYAKDVPDERCTMMILAMLAHDLLLSNPHHDGMDFRQQLIFEELREKYSTKEELTIEIIREDSIMSSEISIFPLEELVNIKLSISSTTITYPSKEIRLIPIEYPSDPSQSVLDTMNIDILDRLEFLFELNDDDDDDDSFDSARSSSTTSIDHRRTSIAATMATISLDDFVELEKTIEKEENKTSNLTDETISSDIDSNDLNKFDETCFADPVNKKIIKETLTLFLSHHQQQQRNENNLSTKQQTDQEREIHAAEILQAHWRGYQIRSENERNAHPILPILQKIRSHHSTEISSLTLRERMMKIVRDFSEASASSVTAYIQFLRDIESIIGCCLEIRYLIVEQGLLRLFFILIRCCNRSEPSSILLGEILNILQLFTVQHDLVMKLIGKNEYIKDFLMLLLKYYQNNGWELFEQICFLLQAIVNDDKARVILRANQSFTDAIEYIYKRLFKKLSIEDGQRRQLIRSTPKKLARPTTLLIQNENIFKQNLLSIEQFMKVFYRN